MLQPIQRMYPSIRVFAPAFEYSHGTNDSNGCSITGGFVYRGTLIHPCKESISMEIFAEARSGGLRMRWLADDLADYCTIYDLNFR